MSCFEILGLDQLATADEVKARWRVLASTAHPDKGGSADEFSRLHKAYSAALAESMEPKQCTVCNGTGKIKQSHGFSSIDMPCMACGGAGHVQ